MTTFSFDSLDESDDDRMKKSLKVYMCNQRCEVNLTPFSLEKVIINKVSDEQQRDSEPKQDIE